MYQIVFFQSIGCSKVASSGDPTLALFKNTTFYAQEMYFLAVLSLHLRSWLVGWWFNVQKACQYLDYSLADTGLSSCLCETLL